MTSWGVIKGYDISYRLSPIAYRLSPIAMAYGLWLWPMDCLACTRRAMAALIIARTGSKRALRLPPVRSCSVARA